MLDNQDNASHKTADVHIEYRFNGFRLDVRQRKLFNSENITLNLSSRAFDTLLQLLGKHGETLSKSELMLAVWPKIVVEENNLNQAISSLRKALGDTKNANRCIVTVPGRGYCFVAPVEVVLMPGRQLAAEAAETPESDETQLSQLSAPSPAQSNHIQRPALVFGFMLLLVLALGGAYLLQSDKAKLAAPTSTTPTFPAITLPETESARIKNSIAVLPFSNLNPATENQLFAIGLHDEVITQLSKIRNLNVIARNSVLSLLDQGLSSAEVARILQVESMMSGTILFVDNEARISLQMLDAKTGVTLWSETYTANKEDLAQMISVQSDIAKHVALALKTEIGLSEQKQIAQIPTTSFEAYRYNLAAKVAHFKLDFQQEWELSRQAVKLDPTYYDALHTYSSVNNVLVSTPLPGMSSHEHFELALATAERMIEVAPSNSEGYALKAVALTTNKDWEGVSRQIDTLLQMGAPVSNLKYIALVLMCMGDFDKAIEIYHANLLTEPLNLYGRGFLMAALELAGQRDQAREEYALGEQLSQFWWGDTVNIILALGRGEALDDIDEIIGVSPELKNLLVHINDTELLKTSLQAYENSAQKISAETLHYAALAAYSGDQELAVKLLRESLNNVWTSLFWVWLPVFDETRKLESFRVLLKESGIVTYWQQHGWPEVCHPLGADSFSCDWQAYPH